MEETQELPPQLEQNTRSVDTLPPARASRYLRYEGLGGLVNSGCLIRYYECPTEARGALPVLVLTDTEHGASVTNRAERAFWLAWAMVGKPWPCVFIEHYRGWTKVSTGIHSLDQEHAERVFFAGTSGDGPIEVPFQSVHLAGPPRAFRHPRWERVKEMTDLVRFLEGGQNVEEIGGDRRW